MPVMMVAGMALIGAAVSRLRLVRSEVCPA